MVKEETARLHAGSLLSSVAARPTLPQDDPTSQWTSMSFWVKSGELQGGYTLATLNPIEVKLLTTMRTAYAKLELEREEKEKAVGLQVRRWHHPQLMPLPRAAPLL